MIKDYQVFRENIINYIAQCGIDIGAVHYIIKDIAREVEQTYYDQINKELEQEKAQKKQEEKMAQAMQDTSDTPSPVTDDIVDESTIDHFVVEDET